MKPDEIKSLRRELRCTPHELADALGVDYKTIMAWEQDELFPTKRHIKLMQELLASGPGSVPRSRRGSKKNQTPMEALSDPETWRIVRKLIAHPALREQVRKLADAYDDPT